MKERQWKMEDGGSLARSVLECGSLLPLWNVQGLNQKVEEKATRLQELNRKLESETAALRIREYGVAAAAGTNRKTHH